MARSYIAEPNHFWVPMDNGEWFCCCRWRPNYYRGDFDDQVARHKQDVEAGRNTFVAVRCESCKGKGVQRSPNGFKHYCVSCTGSGVQGQAVELA